MIWFWLALVVVAVAALLLIWILLEARGIAKEAERALVAAGRVEERTRALWAIPQLNQLLKEGHGTLSAVVHKAGTVADAVAPGEGKP